MFASRLERRSGGKGANQAAAAARAGARTALISAVGDDADGRDQLADLRASGVDVATVRRRSQPADRHRADHRHARRRERDRRGGRRGAAAVRRRRCAACAAPRSVTAGSWSASPRSRPRRSTRPPAGATALGARFVLNPAPVAALEPSTLQLADPLVVNELRGPAAARRDRGRRRRAGHRAARAQTGARSVVVTLGAARRRGRRRRRRDPGGGRADRRRSTRPGPATRSSARWPRRWPPGPITRRPCARRTLRRAGGQLAWSTPAALTVLRTESCRRRGIRSISSAVANTTTVDTATAPTVSVG